MTAGSAVRFRSYTMNRSVRKTAAASSAAREQHLQSAVKQTLVQQTSTQHHSTQRNTLGLSSARQSRAQRVLSVSPGAVLSSTALAGVACLALPLLLAGCGNSYRPVVSAINPVGPSSQPTKYALALADPGSGRPGIATLIDFSGDSVAGTLNVAPLPTYLAMDTSSQAYVLHQNTGLVEAFTASQNSNSTPSFITRNVTQTTLPAGSGPSSGQALTNGLYIVEPGTTRVAALTAGSPPTIRQEFPVALNPQYVVGSAAAARVYALSQGTSATAPGTATGVENSTTNAISNVIPVGNNPIYGVVNSDARRAFILNNNGDATSGTNGTVSVINVQTNALDTIPRIQVGQHPVWADVDTATNELVVLNQGDGTNSGSVSIINIPLCSTSTVGSNANCDVNNPIDAAGFGAVLSTIPVGRNPIQVAVLQDQNKAYVANSDGTVTVIDLQRMVATSTIQVGGTLNWIAATSGSPTGKVYVTASNTQVATVIRTDTDVVLSTVPLQGNGVAIRVTAQ